MKREARPRILYYLRRGLHRSDAAKCAGVAYETLRAWMHDDAAFSAAVLEAESRSVRRLADRIEKHAVEDWKAAAWLLERRHPKKYGRRDRVDGKHSHTVKVLPDVVANASEEQLREWLRAELDTKAAS